MPQYNGNGCLLIAVLAILAIFVCYCCCNSNFAGQPEAAKWAAGLGIAGYDDNLADVNLLANKYRMWGANLGSRLVSGQEFQRTGNLDIDFARLKKAEERQFHLDPRAFIDRAPVPPSPSPGSHPRHIW
jgi:hypothetical protein